MRCFRIPGSAFVPVPKVESSLVRIDPLPQPRSEYARNRAMVCDDGHSSMPCCWERSVSVDVLEFVCRELFNQRRKVMRNAAQILFGEHTQYALEVRAPTSIATSPHQHSLYRRGRTSILELEPRT